jgi:hypothetical protein
MDDERDYRPELDEIDHLAQPMSEDESDDEDDEDLPATTGTEIITELNTLEQNRATAEKHLRKTLNILQKNLRKLSNIIDKTDKKEPLLRAMALIGKDIVDGSAALAAIRVKDGKVQPKEGAKHLHMTVSASKLADMVADALR